MGKQIDDSDLKSLNLLYVEDDAMQRKQLSVYLQPKFASLEIATNGQEGLAKFHDFRPDIVISDIEMPVMTGLEMAAQIKEADRDIPIIMTTGMSDSEHLLDAINIGIDNYVVKPVVPRRLLKAIVKSAEILFARREIAAQNERLLALNAQKNEWLGIAAHDLRNPIGVIMGYAELMLEMDPEPHFEEMLERVFSNSQFMKRLLEDLLDISKIESGKLSLEYGDFDYLAFIKECVDLNRIFAEQKSIGMSFDCNLEDGRARFDRDKIEQVLNNLISNAIKYSPSNTEITVRVEREGDQMVTHVIDQGPGIPADEIGNIFKEFHASSVKATAGEKSTGLGLAIAKKIVDGHHGEIWIDSTVGVGTTFSFRLPVQQA